MSPIQPSPAVSFWLLVQLPEEPSYTKAAPWNSLVPTFAPSAPMTAVVPLSPIE